MELQHTFLWGTQINSKLYLSTCMGLLLITSSVPLICVSFLLPVSCVGLAKKFIQVFP